VKKFSFCCETASADVAGFECEEDRFEDAGLVAEARHHRTVARTSIAGIPPEPIGSSVEGP
jgi:hypothetical protein